MKKILALVGLVAVAAAACGGGGDGGSAGGSLTVYSGREQELVEPLFARFRDETGIKVDVRYGESPELAAALREEGGNSPADVFFAQDPGSLGAIDAQLTELPQTILDRVPQRFRDDAGHWVGTSGRSRVIAYNTDAIAADAVPTTVFDLVDAKYAGKVGIAPTNASFQVFVTAMRLTAGDVPTREWLTKLKANGARTYEKNLAILEAIAAGEVDLGLVNHYYLSLLKEEQPDAPVANAFLPGTDPGALVSVAGAGILSSTKHREEAERFVAFLLEDPQQRFYAEEAEEAEYPLVDGIAAKSDLPPLASLTGPALDLSTFGGEAEATVTMLRDTGWLS